MVPSLINKVPFFSAIDTNFDSKKGSFMKDNFLRGVNRPINKLEEFSKKRRFLRVGLKKECLHD